MKSIKLFFISLLTIYSLNVFAQDKYTSVEPQLNISILYPGISAEFPLADNLSFVPKIGLGLSFEGYISNSGSNLNYIIAPASNLQGRFYYSGLKDQTRRGKELFRNSGNYAFVQLSGNLNAIASSFNTDVAKISFGIGWGMQRIYRNNIIFSWGIGLGYDSLLQSATWINEFTLGYVIRPNTKDEIIYF